MQTGFKILQLIFDYVNFIKFVLIFAGDKLDATSLIGRTVSWSISAWDFSNVNNLMNMNGDSIW